MVQATPFRAQAFKSAYGPNYHYQPSVAGYTTKAASRYGFRVAALAPFAGVAALFFASGIPRIQNDIISHIPFLRDFYKKEVHPQDNPF